MPIAALLPEIIPAVLSIGGSLLTSGAAHSAADRQSEGALQAAQIQAQSAKDAQAQQLGFYNQTRSDLAPYMTTGNAALSQLAGLFGIGAGGPSMGTAAGAMSALTQYPGYQFGLSQGISALDHGAASRGLVLSGAQGKALTRFGTDYAQQQAWQPYVSQLQQFATGGQSAASGLGQFANSTGNGIAQSILAGGNAQATGVNNSAQALAGGTVASTNALLQGLQSGLKGSALAGLFNNGGGGGAGYDASGAMAGDGSGLGDVMAMLG